jgi:DNA invertase Pin-like site-specific DNA recombinase
VATKRAVTTKPAPTTRVAIYARVSTTDKKQDVENQLFQLREYCLRQNWLIVEEFVDHMSGKTAARPSFERMFSFASRRQFDVVLVWALDRFTREGVGQTFAHIKVLRDYRVDFESYIEPQFRTTGPAGDLLIAWIAAQERLRISDCTKAGIDRAKRAGKHCGRPKRVFDREKLRELRRRGMSMPAIAAALGIGRGTVERALKTPSHNPIPPPRRK